MARIYRFEVRVKDECNRVVENSGRKYLTQKGAEKRFDELVKSGIDREKIQLVMVQYGK